MRRKNLVKHFFYCSPILVLFVLYLLGFRFVAVLTDSMEPSVPRGSLVVTVPIWMHAPRPGDVVLYRLKITGEYLVLHRIVGVEKGGFVTRGDNRVFRDPWVVRPENVVGTAVVTVPLLGYLLLVLKALTIPVLAGTATFLIVYRILSKRA